MLSSDTFICSYSMWVIQEVCISERQQHMQKRCLLNLLSSSYLATSLASTMGIAISEGLLIVFHTPAMTAVIPERLRNEGKVERQSQYMMRRIKKIGK